MRVFKSDPLLPGFVGKKGQNDFHDYPLGEVNCPSTSGRTSVPASTDAATTRPVAPTTSSGLSWRGLKVPKILVVKRASM